MVSITRAIVKKDIYMRMHRCPAYGLTLDRDVNAARNILRKGIGLGQPESTLVGEGISTQPGAVLQVPSMNQEVTRARINLDLNLLLYPIEITKHEMKILRRSGLKIFNSLFRLNHSVT